MQAGRDMDALIVKAVFGLELQECMVGGHPPGCTGNVQYPHYSTDIADAWRVVEKLKPAMRERLLRWQLEVYASENYGACFINSANHTFFYSEADTAPLAICRAALMAVSQEEK